MSAKKQRVVQVLDIPDLPKTAAQVVRGKPNPPSVQKSTGGHWSQNRKYNNWFLNFYPREKKKLGTGCFALLAGFVDDCRKKEKKMNPLFTS